MKTFILSLLMIPLTSVYAQDFTEHVVSKNLTKVGNCKLIKFGLIDKERYELNLLYDVKKYQLKKEDISIGNYAKHLIIGSGVAGIKTTTKKEMDRLLFNPLKGSSTSLESCQNAKRFFQKELERQQKESDCSGAVASAGRTQGKVNSLSDDVKKALGKKSVRQ